MEQYRIALRDRGAMLGVSDKGNPADQLSNAVAYHKEAKARVWIPRDGATKVTATIVGVDTGRVLLCG